MSRQMAEHGLDVPEHLYPEDAFIDDLTPKGRNLWRLHPDYSTFKPVLEDGTLLLYQIMDTGFPAQGPWMTGLKSANGKYTVFTVKGARNADASVRCEKPFDKALGDRVAAAWKKVLLETRPTTDVPYIGADGAFVHFGFAGRVGMITGKIWSPPKPFMPGWLWQVASGLGAACDKAGDAKAAADLETALKAIEAAK